MTNLVSMSFFKVQYKGETKDFSAEEISSMVLSKLKSDAEVFFVAVLSENTFERA
jgi:molecular chaperone DnaK (HSP70)